MISLSYYLIDYDHIEPALIETENESTVDAEAQAQADYNALIESMHAMRMDISVQQAFMDAPTATAVPPIPPPPPPPPPPASTKKPNYGGKEPEPPKIIPNQEKYETIVLTGVPALTKKQLWHAATEIDKADAKMEKLAGISRDVEIVNRF